MDIRVEHIQGDIKVLKLLGLWLDHPFTHERLAQLIASFDLTRGTN